jgi:hypothetical protein
LQHHCGAEKADNNELLNCEQYEHVTGKIAVKNFLYQTKEKVTKSDSILFVF